MAFFVGQKVVCIWGDWDPMYAGEIAPIKGSVYTIRQIDDEEPEGLYFTLEEIKNPTEETEEHCEGEAIFFQEGFRPLEYQSIKDLIARVISPDKTRRIPVGADGDLMR